MLNVDDKFPVHSGDVTRVMRIALTPVLSVMNIATYLTERTLETTLAMMS